MTESRTGLGATAYMLGLLWLREIDDPFLAEVASEEVRTALSRFGLNLPDIGDEDAHEKLSTEYFQEIAQPASRQPPVQSLVTEGSYEGAAAVAVRRLAKELGVELDHETSRGAPVDHLGVLLALWSELDQWAPETAPGFATAHLAWAVPWCSGEAPRIEGFYGQLFALTGEFLTLLPGIGPDDPAAETAPDSM